MHLQSRSILTITALAFALASGLRNEVSADELKEAKVTQVVQDVQVLPSNASPRPAAVNEMTIFSVGEGPRTIDLGSGQFLLYVPKKAGGVKVKAGPVTAGITG